MADESTVDLAGLTRMPHSNKGLHVGEAFSILFKHLGLFTGIILTVWLPGTVFIAYLRYYVFTSASEVKVIRISSWYELLLGPISVGAAIYALSRIRQGDSVKYKDAMRAGLSTWGKLLGNRFMANLIIGLATLALVVPGVLLLVRYAFISPVVIFEGKSGSAARKRSTKLTEGRRNRIFAAGIVVILVYLLAGFLLYLPQGFSESLVVMSYDIVVDSLLNVLFGLFIILPLLFYWESSEAEMAGPEPPSPPSAGNETPQEGPRQ